MKLFRVEVYPKCARSLPCLSKTDLERPGLERIGKLNDRRGIGDVGDEKKNAKRARIYPRIYHVRLEIQRKHRNVSR